MDVRRAEVDEDVGDEHDVDDQVDDDEVVRLVRLGVLQARRRVLVEFGAHLVLVEQEGGAVRREDGRVQHEQQHDPVPHRLERRVVQDDEARHRAIIGASDGDGVGDGAAPSPSLVVARVLVRRHLQRQDTLSSIVVHRITMTNSAHLNNNSKHGTQLKLTNI